MEKKSKFIILVITVFLSFMAWSLLRIINVHLLSTKQMPKFSLPQGKVLFIVGQDRDTIDAYVNSINITPGGFMVYTSIQNMDGLYSPVDYGGGVQHFQDLVDRYPNTVIQIGLYMVGALDGVIEGLYDMNVGKLAEWIKKTDRPVYLRIGYEFDGSHNSYEPDKYVKAYRYIVDKLRKGGVDNVAYVWHSCACYTPRPIMDWYPGDRYVDWFAISYFNRRTKYMDIMAQLAAKHNKPLMIAESTPCGIGTYYADYAWDRWFRPFFDFVIEKDVKVVCYINSNWEAQQMWKGQGWQDARVQANEIIKKRWLNEINKERYLQSSPNLYEILGY